MSDERHGGRTIKASVKGSPPPIGNCASARSSNQKLLALCNGKTSRVFQWFITAT